MYTSAWVYVSPRFSECERPPTKVVLAKIFPLTEILHHEMFGKTKKIDDEFSQPHSQIKMNYEMNNLFPLKARSSFVAVFGFAAMVLSGLAAELSSENDSE